MPKGSLNVILLHENMYNKRGDIITTSLTMIDSHDISRSSKTYGANNFYIAHPSPTLQNLANTLKNHWMSGFGSTYNPNRKEALGSLEVVNNLEEAVAHLEKQVGKRPILVATSAREVGNSITYKEAREKFAEEHILLMLGTGWGMTEDLLSKADYTLKPVNGPGEYNHLSVRSACAIMLDKLAGTSD